MAILFTIFKKTMLIVVCFICLGLMGCKGTETREEIDDTVEELAGKKNIDRMEEMKKAMGKIEEQQTDRLEQFDDEQ